MRAARHDRRAAARRLHRAASLALGAVLLLWAALWVDAYRPPSVWAGDDPVREGAWLCWSAVALQALRLATAPRARARLRRTRRQLNALWATAPTRRRAALVLAGACLAVQLVPWLDAPVESLATVMRVTWSQRPWMTWRPSSEHVPPLVDHVVTRADAGPLLVRLVDEDPRAYQASYYCYPRLLVMDPDFRTWSNRWRQLFVDVPDPGFADPGAAPAAELARDHAARRGLEAVLATPLGVVPLGPPRDATAATETCSDATDSAARASPGAAP